MSPAPEALDRAVPLLRCPQCGSEMRSVEAGVRCAAGHAFDRARQGYLSLFGPRGRRFPGDSSEQVAARERVLRGGLFDDVAAALAQAARDALAGTTDPVILEPGGGTGFYLEKVIEAVAQEATGQAVLGIGTEISVPAVRRLARVRPEVAALVADTWEGLPVADRSVDLLQVVFAPRNTAEFARVLRPGGTLVVAGPGPGHLEPLRSRAGMLEPPTDRGERLADTLAGAFEPGPVRTVDVTAEVTPSQAVDLALMGPSGVHLDRDRLEAQLGAGVGSVRVHVEVRVYRPASDGRAGFPI